MIILRELVGKTLRHSRLEQGRSLRDVAKSARVSLGYLSEVERGQKEASSEMLNSICAALEINLNIVLKTILNELEAAQVLTPLSLISGSEDTLTTSQNSESDGKGLQIDEAA
jgi:transcriptional regulator with XRE-family HTH domain